MNFGKDPATPASVRHVGIEHNPAAKQTRVKIQQCIEHAKASMLSAQQRYKANADLKTQPLSFKEGDRVLLSTKNLRSRAQGANKLLPRFVGPFLVTACVGSQAYEIELPASMRIHNVFHVSLLKPYHETGNYQPPPCTLFIDGDVQYDVAEIADVRSRGKVKEYLVKWTGYGSDYDTWEPEDGLANSKDKLQEFWDARGGKPTRQPTRKRRLPQA